MNKILNPIEKACLQYLKDILGEHRIQRGKSAFKDKHGEIYKKFMVGAFVTRKELEDGLDIIPIVKNLIKTITMPILQCFEATPSLSDTYFRLGKPCGILRIRDISFSITENPYTFEKIFRLTIQIAPTKNLRHWRKFTSLKHK